MEIGCNTGANLIRIKEAFPNIGLTGVEINERCAYLARQYLPGAFIKIGDYHSLPFVDNYVDLVLADAVLMYSNPEEIDKAMAEVDRISSKYVIIVDRFDKSEKGVRNGHVWARNYPKLLRKMGYKVKKIKINPEDWPHSIGWQKHGVIVVAKK